ncbi:hypothetical protein BB558_001204 [Smittium angustum]|uniref:Uncharacterized protein n=1 Tax=Smittium angustum TaxID=133377 RepID=A0A2U1JC08_SMIAN|nr:hypothetical protein BB558_001204 [Smittium angustum]
MSADQEFENHLSKTRVLASSNLQNHQQYAGTLIAIEETLKEQGTELVPTSYTAALITLLEQNKNTGLELAGSILYLLAITLKYTPPSVAKAQFSNIMSILSTTLDLSKADAMVIRSVLLCLESILKSQDSRTWRQPTALKAMQSILILGLDPRPKVRKQGQESAIEILKKIPMPLSVHPAANETVDFLLQCLKDAKKETSSTIHVLHFIAQLVDTFPNNRMKDVCTELIIVLKLNDPFVFAEAFNAFSKIFNKVSSDFDLDILVNVLGILQEQKPNINDINLSASWLNILGSGYSAFYRLNPQACEKQVPSVIKMILPYVELGRGEVKPGTISCLKKLVSGCIRPENECEKEILVQIVDMLTECLGYRYKDSWIGIFLIIASLSERLGESSRPVMDKLLKLVEKMKTEKGFDYKKEADATLRASLAAMGPKLFLELFPLNIEQNIPGMNGKNKKGTKGDALSTQEGRAWLLPLMKGHIKNADISYFVNELLPLAEKLEMQSIKLQNSGRAIQSKVVFTMATQIWSLLGGFFNIPSDVCENFNQNFVEQILRQIIEVPDLRPTLCNALDTLVKQISNLSNVEALNNEMEAVGINEGKSNKNSSSSVSKKLTPEYGSKAIKTISSFASTVLSTLFTLVAETPAPRGQYIHEVISTFLSITEKEDITQAFKRVINMLSRALQSHKPPTAVEQSAKYAETNPQPPVYSMIDLFGTLAPFLDIEYILQGLDVIVPLISQQNDISLQKKSYKVLGMVFGNGSDEVNNMSINVEVSENIPEKNHKIAEKLVSALISSAEEASPISRRHRLNLLAQVTRNLPESDLHNIPLFLSEAIIGTKEANDKGRKFAFELLVIMAEKMAKGGKIDSRKLSGNTSDLEDVDSEDSGDEENSKMNENEVGEVSNASLEEYFKMVVAGFAAKTPYMVSASITSLAFLLNRYHQQLTSEFVNQLIDTILIFVNSNNREIAKASLGFVKVVVVSLPKQFPETFLERLVEGILKWANEHRARFSLKSRQIIERLMRRVGQDAVEKATPEEHKKLIINIKKRKLRAKRGKLAADEAEENETTAKTNKDDIKKDSGAIDISDFDGSNSEYDGNSSDDELDDGYLNKGVKGKGKNRSKGKNSMKSEPISGEKGGKSWIMEDGNQNDPLDFLSRSAFTHMSSTKPRSDKKAKQEESKSSVPLTKDGKMIFDDSDDEKDNRNEGKGKSVDQAGPSENNGPTGEDFYKESLTSADGFTRGMRNKIKFNKRKSDDFAGDEDDIKPKETQNAGKGNKRQKADVGNEYKSKRGKGDIKKKGKLEPYAYVPLDAKHLSKKASVHSINKSKKEKRMANKK